MGYLFFQTQERKKVSDMGQKQQGLRISDAVAQLLAIRAYLVKPFPPANGPDADEETDQVELAGSSRVAILVGIHISSWPAQCPGMMCWLPSSACDICIHDGAKPKKMKVRSAEYLKAVQKDMEEIHDLLVRYKNCSCVPLQMQNVMGDGRHAAQDEVHEMATNRRGNRARAEQHGLGRRF